MDRGAWQATVHGVARLGHGRVTNTFSLSHRKMYMFKEKINSGLYIIFLLIPLLLME